MVGRDLSSQQSYMSSYIEPLNITNYGTFEVVPTVHSLKHPDDPVRQSTADRMRSYCLYSHEQMRQIEIQKHLDRKLHMSMNY